MIVNGRVDIHDRDFKEMCEVIDTCEGNVYLVTPEGDKLNLKSKLCQLIGLGTILGHANVTNARLVCDNKEDEAKLFRFNLYGHA